MIRLLIMLFLIGGAAWLLRDPDTRRDLDERVRDLSDSVTMFLLRSTAGFAEEASPVVQAEDRARRLRWQ